MEFLEHDMKTLMETMKSKFTIGEVKTLMKQLLSGVHHLHDNWILHRDLKTSNLLLNHKGTDFENINNNFKRSYFISLGMKFKLYQIT